MKLEFLGQYDFSVDRGRVKLPSKYASTLAENEIKRFIITTSEFLGEDEANYLVLFPTKETAASYGAKVSSMDTRKRIPANHHTELLEMNGYNKISIQKRFLDFAEIEKDGRVIMLGVSRRIELWNPEAYKEWKESYSQEEFDKCYEEFLHSVFRKNDKHQ